MLFILCHVGRMYINLSTIVTKTQNSSKMDRARKKDASFEVWPERDNYNI